MQTLRTMTRRLRLRPLKSAQPVSYTHLDVYKRQIHTCANLIIYGHHMLDGGLFSDLELYKPEAFWENHKYVRFDTLDAVSYTHL